MFPYIRDSYPDSYSTTSKYSSKPNTGYQNLFSIERGDKTSKVELSHYYDYDKESNASTYDSRQRTKLSHTSYSDSNILRYQKYECTSTKATNPQVYIHQKLKLSNSNNSLLNSTSREPTSRMDVALEGKRNSGTYPETYLRNSRQWDFIKKPNRKGSGRNKIQESIFHKYEKYDHNLIKSQTSYEYTKDIPSVQPIKISPYNSLKKQEKIPMFIQQKQINVESPRVPQPQIRKSPKTMDSKISINDFELGKSCGKGMYGNVYVARLKANGSLFAIKKISKQIITKNKMQSQLALEIKLQMFLDHPNILKLYYFFQDKNYIYLVMQYMEEGSLFDCMQRKRQKTSEKQTAEIIIQVANALTCLHDLDIVHRDIKPQNIVVSNGVRKLCDFGWATICTNRRSTYCGTFDYAAPEILEGNEYDCSVDLWCLGVLAYQLLTRKVPFYDASRKESIRRIVNSDKQGAVFPSTISVKCRHFIENLMRKRPQERLTAEDLHLHPFLASYLPK